MPQLNEKLVNFHEYCHACKHWNKKENDDPCDKCLGLGVREGTQKPLYFEAKGRSK